MGNGQSPHVLSRRAFVVGALACAVTAAGCSNPAPRDPAPADGLAPADAGGQSPALVAVDGGTLAVSVGAHLEIDPARAYDERTARVCNGLFDPLTAYDRAKGSLVGKAATSWESNDDATEFVFHLREGAAFHNGNPVTSRDFLYAWTRLVGAGDWQGETSPAAFLLGMVEGFSDGQLSIECADDYTMTVKLSRSYPEFPYAVSHLATAPVPMPGQTAEQYDPVVPVGNGPFRIDGSLEAEGPFRAVKNENYWGDAAHVDGIEYVATSSPSQSMELFQAGTLDVASIPVGDTESATQTYGKSVDGYTARPGEQVLWGTASSTYALVFNMEDDLAGNVHLRRALSMAIDRDGLSAEVAGGGLDPADNIVSPSIAGYEKGAWAYAKHDPDAAAEELAQAIEELGAPEPALTLAFCEDEGLEAMAQTLAGHIEGIGVHVDLAPFSRTDYLAGLFQGGFQLALAECSCAYPTMDGILAPLFLQGSPFNWSRYGDAVNDESLLRARSVMDDGERERSFKRLNASIAEDAPLVPLLFSKLNAVCSNRVNDLFCSVSGLIDLQTCWLSA